jgi:hypothetical protein
VCLLDGTADGELRICVPVSDVIKGQFDENVKMLLGFRGECDQIGSYC